MIKKSSITLLLCIAIIMVHGQSTLPVIKSVTIKKDTFNILKFGAKADGTTLNTESIRAAIIACNKKGGGTVVIPAGLWISGPIELLSNVNLCIQKNALLQFTEDFSQYPLVQTNWEGLPQVRNQSPLYAVNAVNIAITGEGIIDGNGDAWRMVKKDKLTESQWKTKVNGGGVLSDDKKTWYPSESSLKGAKTPKAGVIVPGKTVADYEEVKDFLRPNLLVFTRCDGILLEGVTFQNSPAWCLHPLMSSNVTVRNISVKNPWYAQNGDGIDIESCRNVLVENSVFDVGDDGICIKSGRDEEGRKRAMPTQDVIIRNCTVYHSHGGFVIGSEMSGGAKNIYVNNCTFIGADIGLRFKTTRGRGGIVENIFIKDIVMKDIPGEAILFDMYYAAQDPIALAGETRKAPKVEFQPVTAATPQFKNIHISNVVADGADKAIFIRGLPEMNIRDIFLKNITIVAKKGIDCSEATNIEFDNVKIITPAEPVIDIQNSKDIRFTSFSTLKEPVTMLRLGGDRVANIQWLKSRQMNKEQIVFEFGANENTLRQQ